MRSIAQEEASKGRVKEGFQTGLHVFQTAVRDPRVVKLAGSPVPAATVIVDVCTKCGTLFAVMIDRGEITLQADVRQAPQSPLYHRSGN